MVGLTMTLFILPCDAGEGTAYPPSYHPHNSRDFKPVEA